MSKLIRFLIHTVLFAILIGVADVSSVAIAEDMGGSDSTMGLMRKKRYRYRKRTHRIQWMVNYVPWHRDDKYKHFINLGVIYGYNFGHFELGPYVRAFSQGGGNIQFLDLSLGGWVDFNIIKNTRRNKFVPALGVQAGYLFKDRRTHNFILSPRASFKYFVASRTGVVLSVYYETFSQFQRIFRNMQYGIGVSMAYVHYFH